LKDGISFRYVVLDTWEKFGYTPNQWDKIDKDTQMELIQKRNLDLAHDEWLKEQSKKEVKNNRKGNRG
ncbi:MAG: hypothetical protein ACOCRU_02760, partial [bacterium]